MKYDIFISYKSQYISIVKAVCHTLEEEGIRCWYAPRDLDSKGAGRDYDDEIVEAINASRALVVILSNEALESEWVKNEITQAQHKKKFIIPYVVNELSVENGLRMRLQNKHWIDAYPNPERKFALLLNNVKLVLNQSLAEDDSDPLFDIQEENDFENDFDYEEGEVLYKEKEYNDAIIAFLSSAERGNPKAKATLCQIFVDLESKIDIITNEIWDMVERQAKANHCYANFIMHAKYYKEASNHFISFEYLKKAIKGNHIPLAFLRLGIHYAWGMGVKQNHTLALHYYKKALDMGCATAYSYLGQELEYGSDKLEIDKKAALECYQKGAMANDRRSIKKLIRFYLWDADNKDIEKAKEWAQKAIDLGYDAGYTYMGDVYYSIYIGDSSDEHAEQEAIKWYKDAVLRDANDAYAALAMFYWQNGNSEEAYKWAKRGQIAQNSESIFYLAYFYELDGNYEEAWKCNLERYNLFGVGAESLGKLFIEYEYKPEDVTIEELVAMLEVEARNSSEESLSYLITLYSDEKYGMVDKKKVMDYYKLGASMGYAEQMYEYGLTFMGDNERIFNPYKGLHWIECAARKGNKKAVFELLSKYKKGNYEDRDKLKEWGEYAILHDYCNEDILPLLLRIGKEMNAEEYKTFLLEHVNDTYKEQTLRFKIIHVLLRNYFEKRWDLETSCRDKCIDAIKNAAGNYGYLTEVRSLFPFIYSDFKPEEVEKSGGKHGDFEMYYQYCGATSSEVDVAEQDKVLSQLYSPAVHDDSYAELLSRGDVCITGLETFWKKEFPAFIDSYHELCERYHVSPVEIKPLNINEVLPFFPSALAQYYRIQGLKCFLSMYPTGCEAMKSLHTPTDEEILDVAEKETDLTVQTFLIEYVELSIETEAVLLSNSISYNSFQTGNMDKLAERLNEYRNKLIELGIENNLPEYTAQNLPEISLETHVKVETTPEDDNDDDEFDRLLEEFLNSDSLPD